MAARTKTSAKSRAAKATALRAPRPVILRAHQGEVDAVAITPDGRYIVTADWRESVCVTALPSGTPRLHSELLPGRITTAGILSDGRAIVAGWTGNALAFEPGAPETTRVHFELGPGIIWHLTASPVAPRFAVVRGDARRDVVQVYEYDDQRARCVYAVERAATPCFLADGSLLCLRNVATEGADAEVNPHSIGSVGVRPHWRVDRFDAQGNVVGSLAPQGAVLGAHAREPRVLLAENQHQTLSVVRVDEGTRVAVDRWAPPGAARSPLGCHACFSPDGSFVFVPNFDALLVVSSDGARRARFERVHTANISDVAATPDGRTLVTTSWDKTVRLWDLPALCALAT